MGLIYLVGFNFSSRTKFLKSVGSNKFLSTNKTQKLKKSPISRANIVHLETLALFQNVSYKMAGVKGIEPLSTVLETAVLPLNQTPIFL